MTVSHLWGTETDLPTIQQFDVKSAEVENGMLCIMLEREIPEAKKPKQIKIK